MSLVSRRLVASFCLQAERPPATKLITEQTLKGAVLQHFTLFTSALLSVLPFRISDKHRTTGYCISFSIPIPDLLRSSSLLERHRMELEKSCSALHALSQPPCLLNAACFTFRQQMTQSLSVFVQPLSLCMRKGRKLALMFNKTNSSKAFSATWQAGFEMTGVWEIWQGRSFLLVDHGLGKVLFCLVFYYNIAESNSIQLISEPLKWGNPVGSC